MRRTADELLARYFKEPHRNLPILHEPSFTKQYERVWLAWSGNVAAQQSAACVGLCKEKSRGRLFPAILNLVFALGSLYSDGRPEQNAEQAESFFRLAKGIDLMDVLHTQMALQPIQLGLLMSVYLQTTERFTECWNMAGLTIRTAQSIGLDLQLEEALEKGLLDSGTTQVDCALRQRLWSICMLLKRYVYHLVSSSTTQFVSYSC